MAGVGARQTYRINRLTHFSVTPYELTHTFSPYELTDTFDTRRTPFGAVVLKEERAEALHKA